MKALSRLASIFPARTAPRCTVSCHAAHCFRSLIRRCLLILAAIVLVSMTGAFAQTFPNAAAADEQTGVETFERTLLEVGQDACRWLIDEFSNAFKAINGR